MMAAPTLTGPMRVALLRLPPPESGQGGAA
jgi:hypothetical protein